MSTEKAGNASQLLAELSPKLIDDCGHTRESVESLRKFLEIGIVRDVDMWHSHPSGELPFAMAGNFLGKHGQKCFMFFSLAMPFLLVADFSLVACSNKAQEGALKFAKNRFRKRVVISNATHVFSGLEDFNRHLVLVSRFFEDMHAFLHQKMKESQGQKLQIAERELAFIIPDALRTFGRSGYNWLQGRSNSFFAHSPGQRHK